MPGRERTGEGNSAADWALLVIDLQNDFLDRRGYYAARELAERDPAWHLASPDAQLQRLRQAAESRQGGFISLAAEQMVDNVIRAVGHARRAERPIAFVRAVYDRSFDILPPRLRNDPDRRHFPCRSGTWGAEFVDPVQGAIAEAGPPRERVFDKHTYDAFFANTPLNTFLADAGVRRVYVCGTETQTCVLATAQHAAFLGYHTTILLDGVWSVDAPLAEAALEIFARAFGETACICALGS